ncbi:hypothetical protein RCL_jg19159.t1 [Rhizophagus clarus]|uniref:Uncharacterized protein n=1 Tax=Rhizophagus clarus TaxID=94130 RepID=A0A8H3QWX2_9GLOM|nr:hypothetical protein RCL_jg19159.t1 [Rhizophagus clarus]
MDQSKHYYKKDNSIRYKIRAIKEIEKEGSIIKDEKCSSPIDVKGAAFQFPVISKTRHKQHRSGGKQTDGLRQR